MDAVVGERAITYDARGLVEPDADVPNVSEVDGDKAVFDAHALTTRQINLELKSLLYTRGIKDVTVRNPGAKHSLGVGHGLRLGHLAQIPDRLLELLEDGHVDHG